MSRFKLKTIVQVGGHVVSKLPQEHSKEDSCTDNFLVPRSCLWGLNLQWHRKKDNRYTEILKSDRIDVMLLVRQVY